ncbi:MAG: GAF domain-containing protein, partial [Anaerolineae bacterium]
MSIPFSVLALSAVATLSLFLTALNFLFWRIHREDRTPLWLAGWLAVSIAFALGRLLQYLPLPDAAYDAVTRVVLTAAYALAWIGYVLGNLFVDAHPRRWERTLVACLLSGGTLLLWLTDLVARHQVVLRTLSAGGSFHGLVPGPLYLPVNLLIVVIGAIAPIRLLTIPSGHRPEKLLMALGYIAVLLCAGADFVSVAMGLSWPRFLDFSYLPLAMFFSYIQVNRIGRLYHNMDLTVQERTSELNRANVELRAEVAERRQAQEASQVSEGLYRMLFDANPHPAWVYDLRSLRFLLVNDAAVAHYGYSRDEFLGMTIEDIRPAEELSALRSNLLAENEVLQWSGPWIHRKKDGTRISVEILSHGLLFDGRPARLVMSNDITKRIEAEAALQESEEKYRTLVESARDGVAIIQEGHVKYLNRQLAAMYGDSVENILGQRFDMFVAPEERDTVLQRYVRRHAGADEPTTYETVLLRKDGTRAQAEITIGAIGLQGKRAEIVVVRDISEHKLSEEALQRQLREMTVLSTVATAGSEATYVDGLIERVTEAVSRMLYPDNCGVLIADERMRLWRAHPSYRGTGTDALAAVHQISEGIAGKAMRLGQNIRVDDVSQEPAYQQTTAGIRSELAVPILVDGRVFGCINAESRSLAAFGDHDERLMTTIAKNMATAIEKIRLLQVEKRRREEAEILYNTTRDLVVERDLSKLLHIIVERAAGMLGASSGALDLCEPEHRLVRCAVSYNIAKDYTGTAVAYGEGAGGYVAETGQSLIVEDYRVWPGRARIYEEDQPFVSVLSQPMRWQGRVIGVIHVLDNTRVRSFTDEDQRMLDLFANQAAMAVENARLFKETSQRAQQAAVLAEVSRDISESLRLDVTMERIASYAQELLHARTCAVYLPEPGMLTLRAIAALGPYAQEVKDDPLTLGEGILGSIALQRSGEIINSVGSDPRAIHIEGTEIIPVEHLMGVP